MNDPVEVWCSYTGRWVSGFQVVDRRPDGGVVVARDPSYPLPAALPSAFVRPASARSPGYFGHGRFER